MSGREKLFGFCVVEVECSNAWAGCLACTQACAAPKLGLINLQGVAEAECRRAADAAEAAYNSAFNRKVASEVEALNEEHQRCMTLARQTYAEGAIGMPLLVPP